MNNEAINEYIIDHNVKVILECSKCGVKTEWIDPPEHIKENYICDDCLKKERKEKKFNKSTDYISGIFGKRYENANFDTIDYTGIDLSYLKNYKECINDLKSIKNNSIIITGSHGTGKTYLMACLMRECYLKGLNAVYLENAKQFLDKYKSFFYGTTHEKNIIDKEIEDYKKCYLLIIDEISKISATNEDSNILYQVINYRYNNMLPFILVGNLSGNFTSKDETKKAFANILGASVADRIINNDSKFYYFYAKSMR